MKPLTLLFLALLTGACQSAGPQHSSPLPGSRASSGWRTDAAWYDGRAEKCVYQASRTIYGIQRAYLATAYTNKQPMDPGTSTKSASAEGIEVFKHHWSERIETENYDYDFSTASFSTTDTLAPFKLTVATQEDCGASFKQAWLQGGWWQTLESVYFPGTGIQSGQLDHSPFVFNDALSLVLRAFPFGSGESWELSVVPSQKSTKPVPFEPKKRRVVERGLERLELPMGSQEAYRLDLMDAATGALLASYWFAATGDAPLLHAMLQYEGPGGVSYRMLSHERSAYWER